jgi:hypothetical protein
MRTEAVTNWQPENKIRTIIFMGGALKTFQSASFGLSVGERMILRKIAYLFTLLVSGLASPLVWAACADISSATNWSNINTHKIIIYKDNKAIAILEIQSCEIYPSSSIGLDKEYICTGDKIFVSGAACDIRGITKP